MSSPLQHHLPLINAGFFVAQLLVNVNMNAFGSADGDDSVNTTPDIPIAPAPYAFLIWLVIYAFVASTVAVDVFYPQYSFFNYSAHPAVYRRYFLLSCITNIAFVVFNNWLGVTHLATLDLFLLWGSLLPIYLLLVRHPAKHTIRPWVHYFASEFSIRIYFGWVSAAALLMVAVSLQKMHDGYLGFSVYAFLLTLLLTLGISAFVYGGEPVVGLVVSWTLIGLAVRDDSFPGSTDRDFDKLQAAAALAAPIIPVIVLIDASRKAYAYWKSRKASDVELIKPVMTFQTSADYGTVQAGMFHLFFSSHSVLFAQQYPILDIRRSSTMEASWFALLNAALFVVQAGVNIAYARCFVTLTREYETLIAPASFALCIWILIYALEALLVLTDVFYPQSSLYADATQPSQLRTCFAITCIANTAWLILYATHHVHAATLMIFILWFALLMLYIYSVNDRNARVTMDWRQYVCSELPISIYIAWVSAIAFNHLAISLQHSHGSYLSVSTYVVHLCIVITFAIIAVMYAKDPVFGLVVIWYLISVAIKNVDMPTTIRCADMSVRASAGEGAAIIGVLIVLSTLYMVMFDRPSSSIFQLSTRSDRPEEHQAAARMTAEVNSAAAAVGCPHHGDAKSKDASASPSKDAKPESCGFNSQMMAAAQHAGGWSVSTDSATIDSRLSKARAVSSIPKSDYTPAHQKDAGGNWEYPSEEMYFKAMKRKGWDPEADQMKTIVAIHNTVNEQSWREVMKWEALRPVHEAPKLKRFIGKPTEYSPKARVMNLLGWSVLPFDRHDWIVERDGKEVRYVIDFYSGQPEPGRPLSVYLDVRPALDSVESALDRVRWQFNEKIRPLLPFQGSLFGASSSASPSASSSTKPESTPQQGRSTVVPKDQAN